MIFRTITDDITGANKSIGLFELSLKDISDKLYDIQTRGFKDTLLNTPTIEFDEKSITLYNQAIEDGFSAQKALEQASKGTNKATIALMESANGTTISTEQMTAAQEASTVAARAQSAAYKAVSVAGNMIAFTLIAKGIQVATDAIDHYVNRAEYAAEAMKEAQQKIDDAQSTLKTMSDTLSENKDRFLELSQGVDKFSNNLSLSEEDYAEYLSISNQLAELFPSLVSGYDDQGNALLAIGSNANETNEKLQSLLETQQAVAQQTLIDNMDDVANGIYYEVKDAKDSISDMESELSSLQQQYKDLNIDIINSDGLISFSDEDYSKYGKAMEKALTSAGLYETAIQLISASPQQLEAAQKFYDAWLESENEYYHASENGLKQDIQEKENTIEAMLNNPDTMIRVLTELKEEREQRIKLEKENASLLPDANMARDIIKYSGLYTLKEVADIVESGRTELCTLLRLGKVLSKQTGYNLPLNKYIKQGYFKIKIKEKYNTPVTLVTARGLKFIYRLIKKFDMTDEFDVDTLLETAKVMEGCA